MQCVGCLAPVAEHDVFPGGTVRCPACGRDNVVGVVAGGHEPYREPAHVAPEPVRPRVSGGLPPLCPRCPRALEADSELEGLRCSECAGVFLPHGALTTLIETERPDGSAPEHVRHAARVPREPSVHYARCPECQEPMARMNFGRRSGIVVDACRSHGTWFDGGELDAALGFVRAGGIGAEDEDAAPRRQGGGPSEAERLERQLEAELRAETARDVANVEEFAWETGNLILVLTGGRRRYRRW
jgi:Zn-finger nucleic acid-binding protein